MKLIGKIINKIKVFFGFKIKPSVKVLSETLTSKDGMDYTVQAVTNEKGEESIVRVPAKIGARSRLRDLKGQIKEAANNKKS
jgi:hypothetical protein